MAHWLIELEGTEEDLQLLARFLSTDKLQMVQEDDAIMLKVPSLGQEDQPATIFDDVKDLLESINGAAKVFYPKFMGISFNKIIAVDDGGKQTTHVLLTAPQSDYQFFAFKQNDDRLSRWIDASLQDEMIARAFSIYGSLEHNWKNLYMVVEVIEEDLGGEGSLIKSGITSRNKLKRFKSTADNYLVVGKEARHASTKWDSPSKPMNINEGREYVGNLLRSWLMIRLS